MKKYLITGIALITIIVIMAVFLPVGPSVIANQKIVSLNVSNSYESIEPSPPEKRPTDPELIDYLDKIGIDKDYVEMTGNYSVDREAGKSPYSQTYTDRKTGKYYLLTSQVPKVNYLDYPIVPGWVVSENLILSKTNTFLAIYDTTENTLVIRCSSDQPNGLASGDNITLSWELVVGKKIIAPIGIPSILAVDPVNSNYQTNVIEIDYGICKRWLRLIEGRYHGYWVFEENPRNDVTVNYSYEGKVGLRLGQFAVGDSEIVLRDVFDNPEEYGLFDGYPLRISDTTDPIYPDANPETDTVDGYVYRYADNSSWDEIHEGTATSFDSSGDYLYPCWIEAETTTDEWERIMRSIATFDTSVLDGYTVTGGTLSLYSYGKSGGTYPSINIFDCGELNSPDELAYADYAMLLSYTTALCDDDFAYADWDGSHEYHDFDLNSAGINWIVTDGITNFAFREQDYEVADIEAPWVSGQTTYMRCYSTDKGAGYQPKLVIEYTSGGEASMSVAPSSKAFGILGIDSTNWSFGSEPSWPLADEDAYFYVYNDGGVAIDVTANCTDGTGGIGSTLTSGSPGADEFRVSLFEEGDGDSDNLTLTYNQQAWLSSKAASSNTSFEVKLEIGSSTETPPTGKTFYIYLIASAS